jgi:CheY-like chemotaxis protein
MRQCKYDVAATIDVAETGALHAPIACKIARRNATTTSHPGLAQPQASFNRQLHLPSASRILMKILIVDDHPILRDGVAALLRQNGEDVTVAQAGNADDAMRMLDQSADFDAIVLDLKLPGMNGLDAISAFAGKCPQLQIIVLSTSEDAADVRAPSRAARSATCRNRRGRIRCCRRSGWCSTASATCRR